MWYAASPEEGEKVAISSTTSGLHRVELPGDFWEPVSASIFYRPSWSTASSAASSYVTLERLAASQMDGRDTGRGGVPKAVAFYNSWLELYPSPNSAYSLQVRYRSHPEDLLGLTSVPSLSTPWRKAVELKTREHAANFVGAYDLEVKASTDYLRYVSTLKTAEATRQRMDVPQRIIPFTSRGGRRRA